MKEKKVVVFVILILTIAVLGASFFILKNTNLIDTFLNKNTKNNALPEPGNTEFTTENTDKDTTKEQSNDESSGGGVISVIEDALGIGCSENQITYSMINLNKTSICNENQGDICVDKTISCSMEIKNRDSEISGFFEVELTFAEAENQDNILKESSSRFFLGPGETDRFFDSTNLQSTGEDGIANKEINCFFNTIEIPKKEVC